jgi:proline iminopeptidase
MRQEYAAFLKRYLDFGGIFAHSEAELQALNAEFGKYYLAAAAARKFSLPAGEDLRDNGGWMVQAVYFGMGRRHDYRAALKDVRAPALVIHGARDLQPEPASRAVAGCFSNARVAVIQEAGHFPFSDRPEPFAAAVGKFLSDLN